MTDLPVSITKYAERQIYRAFSAFEGQRNIAVSGFLKELNIDKIIKQHKHVKFSDEAIIKALIFMTLKGIKFPSQLAYHLSRKANKQDAINLGFDHKSPNQRTFSYYTKHVMDAETNLIIDYITRRIEEITGKFGIIFDVEVHKKFKKTKNVKTEFNRKKAMLPELCKFVKKYFYPFIKFKIRNNAVFDAKDHLDLLLQTAIENQFLENMSNTFRFKFDLGKENRKFPKADDSFYHIKKLDIEALQIIFTDVFNEIYDRAKKANVFKERRFDVAIDFHDWMFYGDINAKMVVGGEYKQGSSYRYQFATIDIIEPGVRFTLLALPIGRDDLHDQDRIVKKLLDFTKGKIHIKRVFADREFFTINIANLLEEYGLKYIIPGTKNPIIKERCRIMPTPHTERNFRLGDKKFAEFNLCYVKGKEKVEEKVKERTRMVEKIVTTAFATNIDMNENEGIFAKNIAAIYRYRSAIESNYRVKKGTFRAKTTSKRYRVRLFYFLYSVALYNIWILLNIIISQSIYGKIAEKPILTSKMFADFLFEAIAPT